mmetsp:Transcript_116604/g.329797  ORF Transcript_116604/g.329797 Transcript_116604/m.329797 type:complete len:257 (-) Transcript_116604:830-1600(-)
MGGANVAASTACGDLASVGDPSLGGGMVVCDFCNGHDVEQSYPDGANETGRPAEGIVSSAALGCRGRRAEVCRLAAPGSWDSPNCCGSSGGTMQSDGMARRAAVCKLTVPELCSSLAGDSGKSGDGSRVLEAEKGRIEVVISADCDAVPTSSSALGEPGSHFESNSGRPGSSTSIADNTGLFTFRTRSAAMPTRRDGGGGSVGLVATFPSLPSQSMLSMASLASLVEREREPLPTLLLQYIASTEAPASLADAEGV